MYPGRGRRPRRPENKGIAHLLSLLLCLGRGGACSSRKQTHIENKRGRRNASPTGIIIFFCRDRRPRRSASNDNNQIKNQHVILSEARSAKSNFCGLSVSEQAEARGILPMRDMAQNLGDFLHDVTFTVVSYRDFKRDPAAAYALRFCLASRSAEVRLRSG